jgi:hypothetical protein
VREENLIASARDQAGQADASMMPVRDVGVSPEMASASSGSTKSSTFRAALPKVPPASAPPRQAAAAPAPRPEKPPAAPAGVSDRARAAAARPAAAKPPAKPGAKVFVSSVEDAQRPVPLCNKCGEPYDVRGVCTGCGARGAQAIVVPSVRGGAKPKVSGKSPQSVNRPRSASASRAPQRSLPPLPPDTDIVEELAGEPQSTRRPPQPPTSVPRRPRPGVPKPKADDSYDVLD